MDKYIIQFPNSIPDMLCDDIIQMYDLEEKEKFDGLTMGGLNKRVKDTTDFIIPKNDPAWKKINNFLYLELTRCYNEYIRIISGNTSVNFEITNIQTNILDGKTFVNNLMIQKYEKGVGKYIYHNDFAIENNGYRTVTFLWYLNTVEIGGTTDFFDGSICIKPEKGKLVLFPASWCYPHCGRTPISNDKYIITNWFLEEIELQKNNKKT